MVKDRLALSGRGFALDGAAVEAAVGALAHALKVRGLAEGDRVACWLPKTQAACLLPLAAARAGLVSVPINPLLRRAQVAHILSDSGARLLISDPARLATLHERDRGEAALAEEAAFDGSADALPFSARDADEVTQILYTSGSTGRPKGVVLTHRNLMLAAESVRRFLRLTADDRALAVLPLSFDYGQNNVFSAWIAGGSAVALDYTLPGDVVKAVAAHGITALGGVPPLWAQLARAKWEDGAGDTLRRLTNSGRRAAPAGRARAPGAVPGGRAASDVRTDRGVPGHQPGPRAGGRSSLQRGHRHSLRRSAGRATGRVALRGRRAGRAGPDRAPGGGGLLARSGADGRALSSGAAGLRTGRHGGVVGGYDGAPTPPVASPSSRGPIR